MTEIEPIDLTTEDHLPEPELEAATPVTHTEQYVGIVTRHVCANEAAYAKARKVMFDIVTDVFKSEDFLRKLTRCGDDPLPYLSYRVDTVVSHEPDGVRDRDNKPDGRLRAQLVVTYTAEQTPYFTKSVVIAALKDAAKKKRLFTISSVDISKLLDKEFSF